jgi:bifunctional non-homologous end joining protein LigD
MKSENTTLYFREGNADKIYSASLEQKGNGWVVNFAFGRRGATLQTGAKTTSPVAYEKAKAIYDKLVKEKTGKGYTPGPDGTPYQHTGKEQCDTGIRCQLLNAIEESALNKLLDDHEHWLQEKKDGKRLLVRKDGTDIDGINRNGLSAGLSAPIVTAAKTLTGPFVIDGECVGDRLFAFDLLSFNGGDLRPLPYAERLRALSKLFHGKPDSAIELVETATTPANKRILFERLKAEKREGVVFKHCGAPYTAGRPNSGGSQLKYKFVATASLIVARINDKRSVALELYANKKERVSAGNVTIPPNAEIPKVGAVVECRYLYVFAESGHLYQPLFLGVRDDIKPEACTTAQLKYRAPNEDDEG